MTESCKHANAARLEMVDQLHTVLYGATWARPETPKEVWEELLALIRRLRIGTLAPADLEHHLFHRLAEVTDALAREHDALTVLQAWIKQNGGGNPAEIARIVNEGYAAGCAVFATNEPQGGDDHDRRD